MQIESLADHPEALPILAEWQHQEWGHVRPDDTATKRMARLQRWSQRDRIPMTVVALENGKVLGSASLIEHDMETRMELTPWLAGVFVGEEYRRRGIGALLVRGIMSESAKLNVPLLYLYTLHSEKWYASLGWTLLERTTYRGYDCVIMTYAPTNHQP